MDAVQTCPADKQATDNSRTDLCASGQKCCYRTAATSATDLQPTSTENIQLQIPLFDFSNANNIAQYLAKIYEYILIIFVPLTIIMIIWGGIQWIAAAGEANKIKGAKNQITQAFIGLFIGLASYIILSLVGITSLKLPSIQKVQRQEGGALTMQEGGGGGGGGAGGAGGAGGTSPSTTIDPNSCTGTWRGMAVKCLDPELGENDWESGLDNSKATMVATGPVLISKSAGAPPYFVQYVETAKTTGKKIVALTFDLCTPGSGFKQSIPEYLKNNNIKATFFLSSAWSAAHEEGFNLIKSTSLFEIGNHSKTHPVGVTSSPFWDGPGSQAEMTTQWKDSNDFFVSKGVNIGGICRLPVAAPTRMERSGSIKFLKETTQYCKEFIQYSMWPGDTANNLSFIKSHLKVGRGEIILMHAGKEATADTLPSIVEYLKNDGYEFVTVSDLLNNYGS